MEEVMNGYEFVSLMNNFVNQDWFTASTMGAILWIFFITLILGIGVPNIYSEKRFIFLILILLLFPILFSLFNYYWIAYVLFLLMFLDSIILFALSERIILIKKHKPSINNNEVFEIAFNYTSKQLKNPREFSHLFKVLC